MKRIYIVLLALLMLCAFAYAEDEPDAVYALELNGATYAIALDGGVSAYTVRRGRSGTLLLKPAEMGEVWEVPCDALDALKENGIHEMQLRVGEAKWTIDLEEDMPSIEGAVWRITEEAVALITEEGSAKWNCDK